MTAPLQIVREALEDAKLQLRYMHDRFGETGSGNTILARVDAAIDALSAPEPAPGGMEEDVSLCIACGKALKPGDLYYPDYSGGEVHAACCGPEPEGFRGDDGEPLKPGDAIPAPAVWHTVERSAPLPSPGASWTEEQLAELKEGDTVYLRATFVDHSSYWGEGGFRVHFEGTHPKAWLNVPRAALSTLNATPPVSCADVELIERAVAYWDRCSVEAADDEGHDFEPFAAGTEEGDLYRERMAGLIALIRSALSQGEAAECPECPKYVGRCPHCKRTRPFPSRSEAGDPSLEAYPLFRCACGLCGYMPPRFVGRISCGSCGNEMVESPNG